MAAYKLTLWMSLLAIFHLAHGKLNLDSQSNIAIYWGQNSHGASTGIVAQQRLAYYCQNPDIDVFQLSFVTRFNGIGGFPEVNFANAGDNCTTFPGTNLLNCPEIEEDIQACQSLGKTILLSIGGATYTEGGFSSTDAAIAGANTLWNTFGPVSSDSTTPRPFGKAVVDGFDLDFESTVNNMPAFANQLRTLYTTDPSKPYYLTAAPQCPYPDAANGAMLDGTVAFDAIWVQFYNNYCGLQSYVPGAPTQNAFNFDVWDTWARTVSLNPHVRVFVGAPGSSTAAGGGYVPSDVLAGIIGYAKRFASFGGVMVWDVSQVYANSGFLDGVRGALSPTGTNPTPTGNSTVTPPSTKTTPTGTTTGSPTSTPTPSTKTTISTPIISTSTTCTCTPTPSTKTTPSTPTGTSTPSTKTTSTTTTTITATTTTSRTPSPSAACPTPGGTCTIGSMACNGNQFGLCAHGHWVMSPCGPGLACIKDTVGVYCGLPNPTGATTCP